MAEAKIEIVLSNGAKAGETLKELSKDANRLNKEIKDLKPGSQQFIDKSKDLQQVNDRMKEVKDQINGTNSASKALKDAFNQFVPFSGQFQAIGEKITGTTSSVGGLTKNFGLLRGAILATGIGALLVLLGSLISYFTSTQAGMDKVTAVTRPLAAIFERLKGVLQELGEKVFKSLASAIENPKQALVDLGNIILNNIIKRFEALALFGPALKKIFSGDLSEGFTDLGNAAIQATTGIENGIEKIKDGAESLADFVSEAVTQGTRLDELQKQIERAEISQIKRSKELDLIIKQQKFIVEDQTRSFDERRAAAEKALRAQETLLNSELSLIDQKIAKMRLEQSLNDTDNDQKKELAELEAQRLEKEAQMTEQRIEFRNKLNDINKAQAAEELAIQKNLDDLRIEAMKEGQEKEIELINLDTERKISALIGTEEQILEQKLLLLEIEKQSIQAVRDKYAAQQAEKEKADNDAQIKRDQETADEQKRIQKDMINFKMEMDQIEREIALDSLGFASDILGRFAKNAKVAKELQKGIAVLEIGINLQKELALNAQAAAANPLNGVTFGAAGAAQLVRANASSILRAVIGTAKVVAFKKGGVLPGPSHESGGIPFTINGKSGFEAEGGEVIINKKSASVFRRELSAINSHNNWGRKFAVGGPVSPFVPQNSLARQVDSAITSNNGINSGSSDITNLKALLMENLQAINSNIQSVNSRIDRIKVQNVVTETEDALKTLNTIRDAADV